MSDLDFEFDERSVQEFERKLKLLQETNAKDFKAVLRKSAQVLNQSVKAKTDAEVKEHTSAEKYSINKNYKTKVKKKDDEILGFAFNKSPHFHLIEKGHVMKNHDGSLSRSRQFVEGKHFYERTVQEMRDEMPEAISKKLDETIRRVGLEG